VHAARLGRNGPTGMVIPLSMPSWMLTGLVFAATTVLMLAAICQIWYLIGPFAYGGGDGKMLISEIEVFRRYAPPFASHILNPLEGMAAFNSPLNLWLNPVLAPFLLLPADAAALVSTAIGFVCLSAASFVLARSFGVSLPVSLLAAQFTVITFPPFYATTGFTSLFQLVPSVAASTALLMIVGCLLYRIKSRGIREVLIGAAAIGIVAFYALMIDPAWFVGAIFILAPLGLFAVLDAPSADARIGRAFALAICAAVFWATGPFDYLHGLFACSSRLYFPQEWARPQDTIYTSFVFTSPYLRITYAVLAAGWVSGLVFGRRGERLLAATALFAFGMFIIEAGLYLFASFDWIATIPVYYEIVVAAIYVVAAVTGWCALVRFAMQWILRLLALAAAARARLPMRTGSRRWLTPIVSTLIGPAIVIWYGQAILPGTSHTHNLIGYFSEAWPDDHELVRYLRPRIGLDDGASFRGSVLLYPYFDYGNQLTLSLLWRHGVPTLNEYNTFRSPTLYYVLTLTPRDWIERHYGKVPGLDRSAIRQSAFLPVRPYVDPQFIKLEEAWGVRFAAIARQQAESEELISAAIGGRNPLASGVALRLSTPVRSVAGVERAYDLYEFSDPNIGNFSPVDPTLDTLAATTFDRLLHPAFDFRRSIILTEPFAEPLVPASDFTIHFERGGVRLAGHSNGTSVALLPIQFSHCLTLDNPGSGRVVRANLLQTGVVFHKQIDARLSFSLSPFSPGCRNRDLDDLKRLGIIGSGLDAVPRSIPASSRC
jgi:hypothetical protein